MIKTKRNGLTLIEVMLVLALSGVLVVAALSAFSGKSSFMFQNSVRQVGENIRTVANETRMGLGPDNYSDKNIGDNDPLKSSQLSTPLSTQESLFGEAIEISPNCDGYGNWCLVIHKLKLSADEKTVIPYERYPIELPSGIDFDLEKSSFNGNTLDDAAANPNLSSITNTSSNHLVLVVRSTRLFDGTLFNKTNDSLDLTGGNYFISSLEAGSGKEASLDSTYNDPAVRRGTLELKLVDRDKSTVAGKIVIDLANPAGLQVVF